jgi:hypothetical protein
VGAVSVAEAAAAADAPARAPVPARAAPAPARVEEDNGVQRLQALEIPKSGDFEVRNWYICQTGVQRLQTLRLQKHLLQSLATLKAK